MIWSDEQLVRAIKIASEEIVRGLRQRSLYRFVEEESVLKNLLRRLRQDSRLEQLYLASESSTPEIIRQAHFAFFEQFYAKLAEGQRQSQAYEELARYFYRRALTILYDWAPQFAHSKQELANFEFRPLAVECSQTAAFSIYRRISRTGGIADPSRFYAYANHVIKNQCRASLAKRFAKNDLGNHGRETFNSTADETYEIDSADQSQEEIEQLLHFPSFNLAFLSDEEPTLEEPAEPENSVVAQTVVAISANPEPIAEEAVSALAARVEENRAPDDVTVRLADAAELIESGNLSEGLNAYQTAREQIKIEDPSREDLEAKIRDLRQRIRIEKRLEHEAQAALALERDGKWREAEETYRRIAAETASQQRQEELKQSAERCHAERQVADLFDGAVKSYESRDLISAMNRLTRVIRQRPGYTRGGTTAEALLARVKKDWEKRSDRSPIWPKLLLRMTLVGGLVAGTGLIIGVWNAAVPRLLAIGLLYR
jgi:hypothetical protein